MKTYLTTLMLLECVEWGNEKCIALRWIIKLHFKVEEYTLYCIEYTVYIVSVHCTYVYVYCISAHQLMDISG